MYLITTEIIQRLIVKLHVIDGEIQPGADRSGQFYKVFPADM